MCKELLLSGRLLERILLLQLESEMDRVPRASDIQSSPIGDER